MKEAYTSDSSAYRMQLSCVKFGSNRWQGGESDEFAGDIDS